MNQQVFEEAMNTISARRIRAKAENERRYQEINRKIPALAEINYQLAQTASRILSGEDIETVKRQNLQAQQYASQLLENHGYPADYLDMHYTCEKCQDTGFFEGRYCSCLEKLISSVSIAQMNRTTKLQLRTFEQFSLEYYRGIIKQNDKKQEVNCYEKMAENLNFCRQYATNFSTHSPSLLIYGRAGVGKTHLSLSIVTEILGQGYQVIYDSACDLFSRIEQEHFQREKPEVSTLESVLNAELLVLDDLGTEFQTSFTDSVVYNIINTRINRSLPTIITANMSSDAMADMYSPRIVSRLFAVYKPMQFIGEDIRMMKKRNNNSQYL
ncbi:MAG: DNA replication protein DnaC [Ruminococcus sp.]|nr:DNA replication protein DnaC [Ruminococcus sp.]